MNVFLAMLVVLGLTFAVHFAWWRLALPRRQRAALLVLFALGGVLFSLPAAFVVQLAGLSSLTFIQWMNVALGVLSVALAYVVTYSALEADSPTLSLMRHIADAEPDGMTFTALENFINERPFVAARLSSLLDEGMLVQREDRFFLADHPYTLFRLVLFHRNVVLSLGEAGG